MFRPRVIPVLLLLNKGLVKTTKFRNPVYVGDPINAVKIFNDLRADELVFLDISASKEDRLIPLDLLKDISDEAFMPFAAGGGVKSLDDAKKIINAGAEKVVINSAAMNSPRIVFEIAEHFGNQSVIVSIDVQKSFFGKNKVCIRDGSKLTDTNPVDHAIQMEKAGAGEIMINSIDKDGTMSGYNYELIKTIADAVSIPVIACGGAGTINDFIEAVQKGGASAVAAGSMFVFHGRRRAVLISYPERHELETLSHKIYE